VPPVKRTATTVNPPTLGTLRKYGITAVEWRAILKRQDGRCAICKRVPKSGRLAIDHQHVKGWKKMKPEQRRLFVRGLCCFLCNGKVVSKWTTVDRAMAAVLYFREYERRFLEGKL
jgi:hypothetical protein